MQFQYRDPQTGGVLQLYTQATDLQKNFFDKETGHDFYTIAWNMGEACTVHIDGIPCTFPSGHLLPLMMNQGYDFQHMENVVVFRFNREFYCVVDHDREVSCVGFIFYGPVPVMFIELDDTGSTQMLRLKEMFIEEFEADEDIKADMLRTLLVRLIIKLTRLAKKQALPGETQAGGYDLMRQYCLFVERHFRQEKQVHFYAGLLHKSPKTLANLFARYGQKTPLQVIHERVLLEARRLLVFSDKSVKEIAFELGFEEAGHFSKFVKGLSGQTPIALRRLSPGDGNGKNLP